MTTMVMIVSNVRCLFRIVSNIGRRKVDAPGRIINQKEAAPVYDKRFGAAVSSFVPDR